MLASGARGERIGSRGQKGRERGVEGRGIGGRACGRGGGAGGFPSKPSVRPLGSTRRVTGTLGKQPCMPALPLLGRWAVLASNYLYEQAIGLVAWWVSLLRGCLSPPPALMAESSTTSPPLRCARQVHMAAKPLGESMDAARAKPSTPLSRASLSRAAWHPPLPYQSRPLPPLLLWLTTCAPKAALKALGY